MRAVLAIAMLSLLLPSLSDARVAKAPVRLVLTETTARNIVEDCSICEGEDGIYIIALSYSGVFGDPNSIHLEVSRSDPVGFMAGQSRRNRFGDFVFSRNPADPTAITPSIPFPTAEEGTPAVFGFFVFLAEANPSFDRDLIVKEAQRVANRTLGEALRKRVGDRKLALEEYDEIVPTIFAIGDVFNAEFKPQLGKSVAALLNGVLNPDVISLEAYVFAGSTAGDQTVETLIRSADDDDLLTIITRDEIGKRLFSNGPLRYRFDEQRVLVRARGEYHATFGMMALE